MNERRSDVSPSALQAFLGLRIAFSCNCAFEYRFCCAHEGMKSFRPLFTFLCSSNPYVEALAQSSIKSVRHIGVNQLKTREDLRRPFEIDGLYRPMLPVEGLETRRESRTDRSNMHSTAAMLFSPDHQHGIVVSATEQDQRVMKQANPVVGVESRSRIGCGCRSLR